MLATFTVCPSLSVPVLPEKFAVAAYTAVTACGDPATVSVAVENVALPVPSSVTGGPTFDPSIANCTVPVGVPPPDVTVAVNVTICPYVDGFSDDITPVVVLAAFTVWVSAPDVLVLKFPSPLYVAVIARLPPVRLDVEHVA